MIGALTITKLNGLASIQDLGRFTSQHLGFSAGGVADEHAFRFANALLNNDDNCAALEITLGQVELVAMHNCIIALSGADCQTSVKSEYGEQLLLANWQAHQLNKGDVLEFKRPDKMLHSYIAIKNGFQSPSWLASRSQTLSELKLGYNKNLLTIDDPLNFIITSASDNGCFTAKTDDQPTEDQEPNNSINNPENFYSQETLKLRFIPSASFLSLTHQRQQHFLNQQYNIMADSNRMGYRLNGKSEIIVEQRQSELSKPVSYGTIQLPSNGQPIILMKERQTIGGYPVLGNVIQTDLFRLSQKRPGEIVEFVPIAIEQAQSQLSALYQRFNKVNKNN